MFKIIAETAFSHEGNFSYLLRQIEIAAKSNVDYIKFQVFLNKDEYIVSNHSAFSELDKWMFSEREWVEVFEYALLNKLKIVALPLNVSSMEFCLQIEDKIELFEIHSVCFNDIHIINKFKKTNKKIILGVGGRTGIEVENLINRLQKPVSEIILMAGFQSFPTDKSTLNLKKIENFKNKHSVLMGFADHSTFENQDFLELISLAYVLGATYFEKHIVLKKGEKRIDYESAIASEEFLLIRTKLNELESVLGHGELDLLNEKEKKYKSREKQMVYSKDIEKGNTLCISDICYKITEDDSDIKNSEIEDKTLSENVIHNQTVEKVHIS